MTAAGGAVPVAAAPPAGGKQAAPAPRPSRGFPQIGLKTRLLRLLLTSSPRSECKTLAYFFFLSLFSFWHPEL